MGCQSCIRRVQRNLLSIFHWKNDDFWKIFALWAKKFRTLPKINGRVSETSNYVSGENFWERKILKKWWFRSNFVLWVKKGGFWATQFGRGCHSCTRRFQRNLLSIFHWKNDDFWMKFVLWAKNFRTLPKFYCRFRKLQSTCQEKKCEREKKLKKRWFLSIFVLWAKKIGLWAKQLGRCCQNYIRRVQRNIVTIFHWKKDGFSCLFALWAKSLFTSAKHLRQGFRKFNLRVRRKNLRGKKWKKDDFLVILYFELKKIGLWAKQFGRGCHSCIRRFHRNLLSIFVWKNDDFWSIFSLWAKKFRTLPNIHGRVFETSIYVSGEKFWERKTLKKWRLLSNFVLWLKKVGFWAKQFCRGCHSCSRRFQRNLLSGFVWKNDDFWLISVLWAKMFRTLHKTDGRVSETSIYVSGESLERKNWKNDDFSVVLYSELTKRTLRETVWHGLSKPHSACPEESFEHFSLKKRWFLKDFLTLSEKVPDLVENLRQGFQNFNLSVRRKILGEKKNWKNADFLVILYFE